MIIVPCPVRPLPDQIAVFVNFPYTVIWDCNHLAFRIPYLKREWVAFLEYDLFKKYPHNPFLHVIVIPDFEAAFSEFLVPSNSIEKFLERFHN